MFLHHTTGERARRGSCLNTTLQVRGRGGVMSLHHTTGERARWGSCLYTTLQVRGPGGGHVSTPHYR